MFLCYVFKVSSNTVRVDKYVGRKETKLVIPYPTRTVIVTSPMVSSELRWGVPRM